MNSSGEKSSRRYAVPMSLITAVLLYPVLGSRFRKVISERAESTVHDEVLTGDVTGRVRGEVQERFGDVLRAGEPVQGHAGEAVLAKLAHLLLADEVDRPGGVTRPRAHAVDADAVLREIDGHHLH